MVLNKFKKDRKKTSSSSSEKSDKKRSKLRGSSKRSKPTVVDTGASGGTGAPSSASVESTRLQKIEHAFSDLSEKPVIEEPEEEKVTVHLPVICRAEAICAYEPDQMDEVDEDITFLRFTKGDMIDVVEQDVSGWWEGIVDGEWGIFPGSYVQVVELYEVVDENDSQNDDNTSEMPGDCELEAEEEEKSKRTSTASLDTEEKEIDDMLSNLISEYETDLHSKPQAPVPTSDDEEENLEENEEEYDRDTILGADTYFEETADTTGYFPETDIVFGSEVAPEYQGGYDDEPQNDKSYNDELEILKKEAAAKERQMNELLLKHARTARQLDEFLKEEQTSNLSTELEAAQEQITALQLQLSDSESKRTQAEETLKQSQRRSQHSQAEIQKLREKLQNDAKKLVALEEEKVAVNNELATARTQCQSITQKYEQSEKQIQHLKKQLQESTTNDSESQTKALQDRINELQDIIDRHQNQTLEKDGKILQLETINSSLVLKIQYMDKDSQGKSETQDDSVKLLEEQLKEVTEQKDLLAEKLREKAKNEIKLSTAIEKLQKDSPVVPRKVSPKGERPVTLPPQNRGAPRGGPGAGGGAQRAGRSRGRPRGAPRGTPRGVPAPVRGNSVRGTPNQAVRGENGAGGAPRSRGVARQAAFSRPLGPQGRPITRKLIKTPDTPPPVLKQSNDQVE